MTLSEQFTVHMKRQGLTRNGLASKAGVSIKTLRKVLADNEDVKIGSYMRVATALGATIKYELEV